MNKKSITMVIGLVLLLAFMGSCQSSNSTQSNEGTQISESSNNLESKVETGPVQEQSKWDYEFSFGSGSATGNSKVFVTALAKVITDNVSGIRASAAVTPGYDAESTILTYEGALQGGVGTPIVLFNAINGVEPFPKEGVKLNYWFSHNEIPLNFFALKNSNITNVADLKGKKLAMGTPGTSNYVLTEGVLNTNGLSLSDVDIQFMDTSEAINQMKDEHVDAMSYVRDYSGAILELAMARKLVLVQPTKEAAEKLASQYSWVGPEKYPFTERYGTVEVPGDGLCFIQPEGMFISSELSDEVVYAMTKAIFENQFEIQKCSDVYSDFSLDSALKKVPIDPHPGALLYYKEMNVEGWQKYDNLLR